MSSGFWAPFYNRILKEALTESIKNDPCGERHRFSMLSIQEPPSYFHDHEIDAWTYEVISKPNGLGLDPNPLVDDWREGVWLTAIHVAILRHCWHLTVDKTRQSVYRLAIKGLIRRKDWNPLGYDDCEPWPRWVPVNPLIALASV